MLGEESGPNSQISVVVPVYTVNLMWQVVQAHVSKCLLFDVEDNVECSVSILELGKARHERSVFSSRMRLHIHLQGILPTKDRF